MLTLSEVLVALGDEKEEVGEEQWGVADPPLDHYWSYVVRALVILWAGALVETGDPPGLTCD